MWQFCKVELNGRLELEALLSDGWEPFGGGLWVDRESSGDTLYLRRVAP